MNNDDSRALFISNIAAILSNLGASVEEADHAYIRMSRWTVARTPGALIQDCQRALEEVRENQ
jgi:hypothetical protein